MIMSNPTPPIIKNRAGITRPATEAPVRARRRFAGGLGAASSGLLEAIDGVAGGGTDVLVVVGGTGGISGSSGSSWQ